MLDSCVPHGYGLPIPAGAGEGLRAAAMVHADALAPSPKDDCQRVLQALRSGTILRDEHPLEAEATMKLLRVHLADVPLDILETACRAYCNAPGRRFFPRSAGELRAFINPLLHQRKARASYLMRLAEQADREDARAAELAADPVRPGDIAKILAEARLSHRMAAMIDPRPAV
ncbi:hypothetical protein [Sphingomonas zeae]